MLSFYKSKTSLATIPLKKSCRDLVRVNQNPISCFQTGIPMTDCKPLILRMSLGSLSLLSHTLDLKSVELPLNYTKDKQNRDP